MRGKLAIVIGIMMVVSGLAIVPLLGNADETLTGTLNIGAQWDDNWMTDDPTVDAAGEPIVFNYDNNAGSLYTLGDEDADIVIGFQNNGADTTVDTTVTFTISTGGSPLTVGTISTVTFTPGAGLSIWPAAATLTPTLNLDIENGTWGVEQIYDASISVTYFTGVAPGVQETNTLDFGVYVSSVFHDDASDATRDSEFTASMIPAAIGINEFLPYDSFRDSEFTLVPEHAILGTITTTVTAPTDDTNGGDVVGGRTTAVEDMEYLSDMAMDPANWAAGISQTMEYRTYVEPQTAPGMYTGDFQVSYDRMFGVQKTITETGLEYGIDVQFAPFMNQIAAAPAPFDQRSSNDIHFPVEFRNDGNVDLVDVWIEVDQDADDDLTELAFQYEQGMNDGTAGGQTVYSDRLEIAGDTLIGDVVGTGTDFHVGIDQATAAGAHYVPLVVHGYYLDNGALGAATGYVEFEIEWDTNTAMGRQLSRDPMVDLDPEQQMGPVAGYYNFGAFTSFELDLVPEWTAAVDNVEIYVGGNSQTTGVYVPIALTFNDAESIWGVEDVSVTMDAGADTPFTSTGTGGMLPLDAQGVWMSTDVYVAWFMVDLSADVLDEEMFGDTIDNWHVPIHITCTDVATQTTATYDDWVNILIDEAVIALGATPADEQIEEKTLKVGGDWTIWKEMPARLEDSEFTLQVGPGQPYIKAGDPTATNITIIPTWGLMDAGFTGTTAAFGNLLDLNPDVTPGVYWLDMTVTGYTSYNRQYIEVNDLRMQDPVRVLPEPVDIYISSMTMLDAVNPGGAFTVEINVTNLGGQMAHNLELEIDTATAMDPWFEELGFFLDNINVAYVDTTNDGNNAFDTSDWDNMELTNVSFCCPGEWYLPLNESLPLFGIENAYDIYELADWTRGAFSTPVPQIYEMHIDTLAPGATYSLEMEFYADKDMIPGRVYTSTPWGMTPDPEFQLVVAWEDELDVVGGFSTEISMKTDSTGVPYQGTADVAGSGASGDLNTGMMALIVVLLIIIIVLMLLGWSEIRRPYEEDEYDMMEDDFGMDEPMDEPMEEPMPEPFQEPAPLEPQEKNDF